MDILLMKQVTNVEVEMVVDDYVNKLSMFMVDNMVNTFDMHPNCLTDKYKMLDIYRTLFMFEEAGVTQEYNFSYREFIGVDEIVLPIYDYMTKLVKTNYSKELVLADLKVLLETLNEISKNKYRPDGILDTTILSKIVFFFDKENIYRGIMDNLISPLNTLINKSSIEEYIVNMSVLAQFNMYSLIRELNLTISSDDYLFSSRCSVICGILAKSASDKCNERLHPFLAINFAQLDKGLGLNNNLDLVIYKYSNMY